MAGSIWLHLAVSPKLKLMPRTYAGAPNDADDAARRGRALVIAAPSPVRYPPHIVQQDKMCPPAERGNGA